MRRESLLKEYFLGIVLVVMTLVWSSIGRTEVSYYIKSQGEATATTTSQQLFGVNQRRKYILVQNKGNRSVYIKFETPPTGTEGIEIPPGGNFENTDLPISPLYYKTNSGTSAIFYKEGQ